MNFIVVGLNHKTAPIETREKFYLNPTQQDLFLSELKSNPTVVEAFIVSTCNRTEIYANVIEGTFASQIFVQLIAQIKKIPYSAEFQKYFYKYTGKDAVHHLFRVTTGLDSLVLGEKQILGQVKTAFERAQERGLFSKNFNILSNVSIRAGKKAQNETNISFGGSSVSWAAIAMAEKVLGTLDDKSVLIIGAGKMSELAVGQISNKSFRNLYLMNRTIANAEELAQKYGGTVVSFFDIKEILTQVDVCICSTDAPHYILDFELINKINVARGNKKLVLIDISMPRNIDPKVSELENVLLYHIDDLQQVVEENMKKRLDAVKEVEAIISEKLSEFYDKMNKIHELNLPDFSHSVEIE